MYISSIGLFVISVLFLVSGSKGAISDKRLCGDPTCSEPVSYAKTLLRYVSDDSRILSFQANVKVKVFSKSSGTKPGLWGVEINGKRGYAPKDFLREYQVLKGKLDHVVSTSNDIRDGLSDKQDPEADAREESPPELGDSKANLPPFPSIGGAAEEIKNDIVASSETLEPYEVADGTTIYFSTEATAESTLIQATNTDSGIQATVQSQLVPVDEKGNVDTPNPSITLPQPSTSSDMNTEKDDTEGSAEKIYNYLLSNFMPEQVNVPIEEALDAESEKEEVEPVTDSSDSGQKVFVESTESGSPSVILDANKPESDGTAKPQVSPTTASIDSLEKLASNESLEDDEGEDEDLEDDEEYIDSAEDTVMYSEDSPTELNQSGTSTDNKDDSSLPAIQRDVEISDSADKKMEYQVPNSIEIETKLEMQDEIEPDGALKMVHDNPVDTLDGVGSKSDSDKSLEQTSNPLNESSKATHADLVTNDLDASENGSSVESTSDQLQDLGETLSQPTDAVNPDSTQPPLMNTNDVEKSVDEVFSDQNMTQAPENNILYVSPETAQEKNLSSEGETSDSQALPIGSDNHTDSSFDHDSLNIIDTSQNVDTLAVEQELENTPDAMPPSTVMQSDLSSDVFKTEDGSGLSTTSSAEDSTETSYVDTPNEDSPLNVVTDMPALETDDAVVEDLTLDDAAAISDDNAESVNEDDSETSGGFFSNLVGWFGGFRSPSASDNAETEPPEEVFEEKSGGSSHNSVWSYTKRPNREANQHPEKASGCLAGSGSDPDCDNVLPGSEPRVAEEDTQHIMTEQEPNIPRMETGGNGSSSEILSYLGITAVSMVVIILGHWFIEKMRCDSAYIKRINDLERALLYAELESKNLKIDVEELEQQGRRQEELREELEKNKSTSHTEQEVLAYIADCSNLRDANEALEAKNESLQSALDEATQAGLDLNRMLSDLLASNEGSESLIGTVNGMQKELNDQQATISKMKIDLNSKETESEILSQSLANSRAEVKDMSEELKVVTNTLNDFLMEKQTLESDCHNLKSDFEAKLQERRAQEEKLSEEVALLKAKLSQMKELVSIREMELTVHQECISKLQSDGTPDELTVKLRYDVAQSRATCIKLEHEKKKLTDALREENDVRELLEGHVKVVNQQVDMLRKAVKQCEKEKEEAVTKHAVLADYFKDKETQLQKELGYRDALYMQTKGDATSTQEEVKLLNEQVLSYKAQIDTLKKEIVDQERGFKNQIMTFEKKSQENWVAARQIERKLLDSKQEATLLRHKLTILEKNASNSSQSDKTSMGGPTDREMLETGIGSQDSPLLYPNELNVNMADINAGPYPPYVPSSGLVNSPLSPVNYPVDESQYLNRSNHASPANMSRSRPLTDPAAITFTLDDAKDPNSPYFGILSPNAPYDPFYGKPIPDKNIPEMFHLLPLLPMSGPASFILPPPVLPNLNSQDRRPPPLGRMSSPPVMTPPSPRMYERSRRMSPPDRRHRGHRYRRASPPPRSANSPHSPEREKRGSASPQDPRRPTNQERTSSPEHGTSYRRRSPSPTGRYSDSSADSGPDSRRYRSRRYDYSPESSYRSRTPSPTGFRPISREASNNQGSTRGSNHSFGSDESNRRTGRP